MNFFETIPGHFSDFLKTMSSFVDYSFILVIVNFVGIMTIFWIIKQILLRSARRAARSTEWKLDDLIVGFLDSLQWPFFVVFAMRISLSFVKITTEKIDSAFQGGYLGEKAEHYSV